MNALSAPLLIIGAGGHAREVAWLAESLSDVANPRKIAFVVTDGPGGGASEGYPVLSIVEARSQHPGASCVVAIGDPAVRDRVAREATEAGFHLASLVHPSAHVAPDARIAEGVVIFANAVVSRAVVLGPNVHVNFGCSISHDCWIGACSTLSPGVRLAGNVVVEEGAFLGIGASVVQGRPGAPLRIGARAVVGAGACVTRDVPEALVVVGVPARPIPAVPARGAP